MTTLAKTVPFFGNVNAMAPASIVIVIKIVDFVCH